MSFYKKVRFFIFAIIVIFTKTSAMQKSDLMSCSPSLRELLFSIKCIQKQNLDEQKSTEAIKNLITLKDFFYKKEDKALLFILQNNTTNFNEVILDRYGNTFFHYVAHFKMLETYNYALTEYNYGIAKIKNKAGKTPQQIAYEKAPIL